MGKFCCKSPDKPSKHDLAKEQELQRKLQDVKKEMQVYDGEPGEMMLFTERLTNLLRKWPEWLKMTNIQAELPTLQELLRNARHLNGMIEVWDVSGQSCSNHRLRRMEEGIETSDVDVSALSFFNSQSMLLHEEDKRFEDVIKPAYPNKKDEVDRVISRALQTSPTHPAVAAFTMDSGLCHESNFFLRKQARTNFKTASTDSKVDIEDANRRFGSYRLLLISQLASLPPVECTTFKAVPFRRKGCVCHPTSLITWPDFVSSSMRPKVVQSRLKSEEMTGLSGTIFVIFGRTGRLVSGHSVVPSEEEVVFLPKAQFRVLRHVSEAVKALLECEMQADLTNVDIVGLKEVSLAVWSNVVDAMDQKERITCSEIVNAIEQASLHDHGQFGVDMMFGKSVPGLPMTALPPTTSDGTIVHLAAENPDTLGVLQMITLHLALDDLDKKNNHRKSALQTALRENTPGAIHLLSKGACVHSDGNLRLEETLAAAVHVRHRHQELMQILSRVSDVERQGIVSNRVLRAAARQGRIELIQGLLHGIQTPKLTGCLAEACAAEGAKEKMIKWLMDRGAKADGTEYIECIRAANYSLIPVLKAASVDINGADSSGVTAAHRALCDGDLKGLKLLQQHGASISAKDTKYGRTLVHEAARTGNTQALQLLHSWKAPIDVKDFKGATPLWWAAEAGHVDMVTKLIDDYHADPKTVDNYNCSPLVIAAFMGHTVITEKLIQAGTDPNLCDHEGRSAAWMAAAVDACDILQVLADNKADLEKANNHGIAPIHIAASEGMREAVIKLRDLGCNLNVVDNNGWNAVHHSVAKDRFSTLETLVRECGVPVDVECKRGAYGNRCMPLHIAVKRESFDALDDGREAFQLLITERTLDARNEEGETALDIACTTGKPNLAHVLRNKNATVHRVSLAGGTMQQSDLRVDQVERITFLHPSWLEQRQCPGGKVEVWLNTEEKALQYSLDGVPRPPFRKLRLVNNKRFGLALEVSELVGEEGSKGIFLPKSGARKVLSGILGLALRAGTDQTLNEDLKKLCSEGLGPAKTSPTTPYSPAPSFPPYGGATDDDSKPCFTCIQLSTVPSDSAFGRLVAVGHVNGTEGKSIFQWQRKPMRTVDAEWQNITHEGIPDQTGTHSAYCVTIEDLGHQLRVCATPVHASGEAGEQVAIDYIIPTTKNEIGFAPDDYAFLLKSLTRKKFAVEVLVSWRNDGETEKWTKSVDGALQLTHNPESIIISHNTTCLAFGYFSQSLNIRCSVDRSSTNAFFIEGLTRFPDGRATYRIALPSGCVKECSQLISIIRLWGAFSSSDVCQQVLGDPLRDLWKEANLQPKVEKALQSTVCLLPMSGTTPHDEARKALMAFQKASLEARAQANEFR